MVNEGSVLKRSLLPVALRVIAIVCGLWVAGADSAWAQVQVFPNTPDAQITTHTLRQKAPADECWAYLGPGAAPLPMFTNPSDCARYAADPPAKPKVNQAYIWGVAESSDSLWFGTFANGNCVTQAGSSPANLNNPDGAPTAYVSDSWVCEYYDSPYYPTLYPNALIGDTRTPRAYQYDKATHALIDKTPRYPALPPGGYLDPVKNPEGIFPLLIQTRGIRSAAVYNNVVLLAGPNLSPWAASPYLPGTRPPEHFSAAVRCSAITTSASFSTLTAFCILPSEPTTAPVKSAAERSCGLNPSVVAGCTFNPATSLPCFLLNGGTPQRRCHRPLSVR